MRFCKILFLLFLALALAQASAQKQLVLLKRGELLLRLRPGDDIVYKLKESRGKHFTYINNLSDTAIVTGNDTIAFRSIDRLYFTQHKFYNTIGTVAVIGGVGLFLIDQLNYVVIQGNEASLDNDFSKVCIGAVAVGIPLILIKKKSQKLNYKYRLMTIRKGSPFYEPDPKGYFSPFIDN